VSGFRRDSNVMEDFSMPSIRRIRFRLAQNVLLSWRASRASSRNRRLPIANAHPQLDVRVFVLLSVSLEAALCRALTLANTISAGSDLLSAAAVPGQR
jgi:hypothetical protein